MACDLVVRFLDADQVFLFWVASGNGEDWRAGARVTVCAGVHCTVQRVRGTGCRADAARLPQLHPQRCRCACFVLGPPVAPYTFHINIDDSVVTMPWSSWLLHQSFDSIGFRLLQVAHLNDKIKFQQFCEKHGLSTPHVFPITSKAELLKLNKT